MSTQTNRINLGCENKYTCFVRANGKRCDKMLMPNVDVDSRTTDECSCRLTRNEQAEENRKHKLPLLLLYERTAHATKKKKKRNEKKWEKKKEKGKPVDETQTDIECCTSGERRMNDKDEKRKISWCWLSYGAWFETQYGLFVCFTFFFFFHFQRFKKKIMNVLHSCKTSGTSTLVGVVWCVYIECLIYYVIMSTHFSPNNCSQTSIASSYASYAHHNIYREKHAFTAFINI